MNTPNNNTSLPTVPPAGEPAYDINGQHATRAAFYAAACDPRRPVVVQACAGAGKTWMLVSRMLRALLEQGDDLRPDEILAITFTKDAAAEMRERLHQWLAEFALADETRLLQELQARGISSENALSPASNLRSQLSNGYQRLLASGRQVQIQTFHGWFASLLKVAPLSVLQALQLPPSYELVEDDAQAIALVWRRLYARLLRADEDAAQLLADYRAVVAEHGASNTQKALRAALQKRLEFARADKAGVLDNSVLPFAQVFTEFAGLDTPEEFLSTNRDHRQKLREAALLLIKEGSPTQRDKGLELANALEQQNTANMLAALLTQAGTARQFGKLKEEPRITAAQNLALRVAAASQQHAAWQHQQRMVRLARVLLAEYAALKRDRNWVDMNDLERAAGLLLADPVLSGWVQERLDARVRHLLIDEFQDTNPLQWQALFSWLQSYVGANNRAPGVFIVGDPKQSIYRFRRAEPQVFEAATHFVRDGLGGDVLACDHTRRNAVQVVGLVNTLMQAAQEADELGPGAAFRTHSTESTLPGSTWLLPQVPRSAAAPAASNNSPHWRDSLTQPRDLAQERLPELEAAQAAAWLAQAITSGQVAAGDVMVLARKRTRLAAMHQALRERGIASHYLEKTSLHDEPEVRDVVALVEALVSPGHNLALAQALKSPLFAASDDQLTQLALHARQQHSPWWQALQSLALQKTELPPQEIQPQQAISIQNWAYKTCQALWHYQRLLQTLPPHDALDAIYHHGNLMQRFAATAPAPQRTRVLANLQALLASALGVEGGRYLTPYNWLRALQSGAVQAQSVAQPGAVQLLTVHGAKGLEARWVLLLDTDAAKPNAESQGCLIDWPAEHNAPRRFVFLPAETAPPKCCEDLLALERAARAREEINALYVAMTRAKEQLIFSAHEPHRADPASAYQRLQTAMLQGAPVQTLDERDAHYLAGSPAQAVGHVMHPNSIPAGSTEFFMQKLPLALVNTAQQAIKKIATKPGFKGSPSAAAVTKAPVDALGSATATAAEDADDTSARIGQAMHRLLERATPADLQLRQFSAASQRNVAREFRLTSAQAAQAAHMAGTILQGQAAWAWDSAVIQWAGNEVELAHQGALLRIDRLVQRKDSGQWWVLDYKSAHQPQYNAALREQMQSYVQALQAAQPGAVVLAAFVTSGGELVSV